MDAFLARQPIFDRRRWVFGYELLYRNGPENRFPVGTDPDAATLKLISDTLGVHGVQSLGAGKPLFVNVTKNVLLEEHALLLPPQSVCVEILETVPPDVEVVAACRKLKDAGYTIVLDDFVFAPGYEPLVDLADIIKVDFLQTKGVERCLVVERWMRFGRRFLAEKVETIEKCGRPVTTGTTTFRATSSVVRSSSRTRSSLR